MSASTPTSQRIPGRSFTAIISDSSIKRSYQVGSGQYSYQKIATDSIGQFSLTLLNVVVGSVVSIQRTSDSSEIYNTTASVSTVVCNLPAYTIGNDSNSIAIKVRKGSSAPYYKPYVTYDTSYVGSKSIYVSQINDD